MQNKAFSGTMLIVLAICMFTLTLNIQPIEASGTIYIRADGSIYPPTAPIQRDGNLYTLTDSIYDSIVVLKDNIVLDGAGHSLHGTRSQNGITISDRKNLHITKMIIQGFSTGILGQDTLDNVISWNTIHDSGSGVNLIFSTRNSIFRNNITASDTYAIRLYDSSNHNISKNHISTYDCAIFIDETPYNVISGNNLTGGSRGIVLDELSHSNILSRNVIQNHNAHGVLLDYSWDNNISENLIANNWYGIYCRDRSSNNNISGNNVRNNIQGISFRNSYPNLIYHDNFVDNTVQFDTYKSWNVWDGGYPSGGNYWSDHVTVDDCCGVNQDEPGSDGIVDEPYIIDANNRDHYPLMNPWFSQPVHDVAVTNVIPSETKVFEGSNVEVNITVRNEGTGSEVFNVTASYDNIVIGTHNHVTLDSGLTTILTFNWNTSGAPGNHRISAEASVVLGEADTADNTFTNGIIEIIAKTDLPVKGGENATITGNVTITQANLNKNTLHFEATGPSGSVGWINVTFPDCNTTEIKVFINGSKLTPPPFPIVTRANETHYFIYFEFTLSKDMIAIQFWLLGDISGPEGELDGMVDASDLAVLADAYGSRPGEPNWESEYDLTGVQYLTPDEKIDIRELFVMAQSYGGAGS